MSSATDAPTEGLDEWPTFQYEFAYDERRHPSEVTIFDTDAEDVTGAWLTADLETAIDMEAWL